MTTSDYTQVSIVIPTFNRADYLIKCIESCLAQTHPCEIIVCDHGSTDNTPVVMERYKEKVRYIRREHDSGVHFCWLDGIISSKHDLVHINFDDDWILPTFVEECLALFNDEVGFVLSEASMFFQDTQTYAHDLFKLNPSTGIYNIKNIVQLNLKAIMSPCAGIYRKNLLLDCLFVGKIPLTKFEYRGVGPDILFTLMSCIEYPTYGYVSRHLVVFRSHSGSITIDSGTNQEKTLKIKLAYDEARMYYKLVRLLRFIKAREMINNYDKIIKYIFEIPNLPNRILRKIGRMVVTLRSKS